MFMALEFQTESIQLGFTPHHHISFLISMRSLVMTKLSEIKIKKQNKQASLTLFILLHGASLIRFFLRA